jgi:GT2 family glycosyltransferase
MSPFRTDKNLGLAYNQAISLIPDGDSVCIRDTDTCFVQPDTPAHIYEYAMMYPNRLLTCYTNRLSALAVPQLYGGKISDDSDIRHWCGVAKQITKGLYHTTKIHQDISGFCMVLSKSLWKEHPFPENPMPERGGCIAVDTIYSRQLRTAGVEIHRMDGVFVYHLYRHWTSINDKRHLV